MYLTRIISVTAAAVHDYLFFGMWFVRQYRQYQYNPVLFIRLPHRGQSSPTVTRIMPIFIIFPSGEYPELNWDDRIHSPAFCR
jgi:hypothetical protein